MGLWDQHIASLEAMGIRFSDLERRTLETEQEGVRVLHLHPLYDPTSPEGTVWYMEDANGETIYLPEILEVRPWNTVERSGVGSQRMLADDMEVEFGSLSERYPSYFALLEGTPDSIEGHMRTETVHPYAFWTCIPLDSEMEYEAAKRLLEAGDRVLSASLYGEIDFICQAEHDSEYMVDASELWMMEKGVGPKPREGYREEVLHNLEDMGWNDPEHVLGLVVEAFDHLVEARYLPKPHWGERLKQAFETVGLQIRPIEDELAGDFLALQLYQSVRSRMRFMRDRAEQYGGAHEVNRITSLEGTFG